MIRDREAGVQLVNTVLSLAANEEQQHTLAANISKYGVINADEVVAKEILKTIQKS